MWRSLSHAGARINDSVRFEIRVRSHHDHAASYDELPYVDVAYFHTHPSTLAVVATIRGFEPVPVETCRVLDLGCAAGFNLLAMSHSLPSAKLVGIDYSAKQIERGLAMRVELGVTNVELLAADISAPSPDLGEFDYIVAHGVYSWVPEAGGRRVARPRVSDTSGRMDSRTTATTHSGLALSAAAEGSFALPCQPGPPAARAHSAGPRQTATHSMPCPDASAPGRGLASIRSRQHSRRPGHYVFHEYLEADNRPVLFEKFANRAANHGLRFLAEARFATKQFRGRGADSFRDRAAGPDAIRREQQHDFLRNRHLAVDPLPRRGRGIRRAINPRVEPVVAAVERRRFGRHVRPDPERDPAIASAIVAADDVDRGAG